MEVYSQISVDCFCKSCFVWVHEPRTVCQSAFISRGRSDPNVTELGLLNPPRKFFDQNFDVLYLADDYLRSDLVLKPDVESILTNSERLMEDALGVVLMTDVVVILKSRPYYGGGVEAVIAVSYHGSIPNYELAANDDENQLYLGA